MTRRMGRREFLGQAAGAGIGIAAAGGIASAETVREESPARNTADIACWLESSLTRVYPGSPAVIRNALDIPAARNERISFQACIRNHTMSPITAGISTTGLEALPVTVRRVGYVPMLHLTTDVPESHMEGVGHIPGFVPDPLFPDQTALIGPLETHAFWLTVTIPTDAKPVPRELRIRFKVGEETRADLIARIDVRPLVVQPRHGFPVTHWWRAECIWDWYKTGMFEDEKLWQIMRPYIENMVSHGSNTVLVPIFFMRRETFQRPAQLLRVSEPEKGRYTFDFGDVRRFVKLAKSSGMEYFEWSHLWIYWGVVNPIRVYAWKDGRATMLWPPDEDGHGPVYHNFLSQFLPEFHKFLVGEKLLDRSFFHLSDEPGGEHFENYRRARMFLKEKAPWMKVMDALSDIRYGREGLTDIPIPVVSSAQAYIDAGIPHWVYFCCGPRGTYLNRFFDTPLPAVRMSGWLFYHLKANGFLHWGYNYWHKMEQEALVDPFTDASGACWPGIPYGDPLMAYPGPDGPLDSIRWEVFAESLQDYALLQSAGVKPDDPLLSAVKGYGDFPRTEEWIRTARKRILYP